VAYWIKFTYEKNTYLIDLDTIGAFSSELDNKRLTFWLPNSSQPIILIPHANSDTYKQVLDYLKKTIDRNLKGAVLERPNLAGAAAIHFTSKEEAKNLRNDLVWVAQARCL
jgi:hypothetical protein